MDKLAIKIKICEDQFELVKQFSEQDYHDFIVHICKNLNVSPDKVVINWEIQNA